MKDFIINALKKAKDTGEINGTYVSTDEFGTVTTKGTVMNNLADFELKRTKPNGHQCSSMPVMGMPLTDDNIIYIADRAAESL